MDLAHHAGRGQASSFRWGARAEAQRAEIRDGVLGEGGQAAPSPPARGVEERCKLPQQDLGRSPGCWKVFLHSRGTRWTLLELVGGQVWGGMASLVPPRICLCTCVLMLPDIKKKIKIVTLVVDLFCWYKKISYWFYEMLFYTWAVSK